MHRNSGPVQLQAPVDLLDPCHRIQLSDVSHRAVGRKRILVQTDRGGVVGVAVDRGDTAEKVKKAVQAALWVPTDQSEFIFAGHVLEDLSEVRNDSPVLLSREVHRSCSTPSLCCPMASESDSLLAEKTKPFEVVGEVHCSPQVHHIINEASKALILGVEPVKATGGLGGAYYFKNRRGECIAIVKPTDEEPFAPNNPNGYVGRSLGQPGLKRAIRVGEAGAREVAAYILDHDGFASVPHTALVKATHSIFNVNGNNGVKGSSRREKLSSKIGSFQQYVDHDFDASEHGTSRFPVSSVHRIGILDVRIFNTDRHSGNILVKKLPQEEFIPSRNSSLRFDENVALIPIDHGFCLPETLESAYFEWLHWPQASLPFSQEELEYIRKLDPDKDVEELMARIPNLRDGCFRILKLSTTLLKLCAEAGFTLADIGEFMSRNLSGMDEEASEFENLCFLSKRQLDAEEAATDCIIFQGSNHRCASESLGSEEGDCEKEEVSVSPLQFDLDNEDDPNLFELSRGRGLRFAEDEKDEDEDDLNDLASSFHRNMRLSFESNSIQSGMYPIPPSFSSSSYKSPSPDLPSPITVHGFDIPSGPKESSMLELTDSGFTQKATPLSCSLSTRRSSFKCPKLQNQRSFSIRPSKKTFKPCFNNSPFPESCTNIMKIFELEPPVEDNASTIPLSDKRAEGNAESKPNPQSTPQIMNSIDFSAMHENSWVRFYDIFCELLDDMIRKKCRGSNVRVSQRFGMSCQF